MKKLLLGNAAVARGAYEAGVRLCHLVSSDESAADERARMPKGYEITLGGKNTDY